MMIPGFYEFQANGRGDPQVSTLVGAIPARSTHRHQLPTPQQMARMDADSLVLVFHLFMQQNDPFCVVLPTGRDQSTA